MSATERLRAMLDERGVEHFDSTDGTYWGGSVLARDGSSHAYRFSARESVGGLNVHLLRATPEQAIEATLGLGTCKARLYKPEHGSSDCTICECGEINDISANYCNRCGRRIKVVRA